MPIRPRYRDLFAALLDPDPRRADAAFDAVLFDRGEAVPDLAELLRTARDEPRLRFLAVQLLGFSASPDALPHLVAALDDPHPDVRAEACRALEDLGASDAAAALRARLDDVDPEVRRAAAEALDSLAAPRG